MQKRDQFVLEDGSPTNQRAVFSRVVLDNLAGENSRLDLLWAKPFLERMLERMELDQIMALPDEILNALGVQSAHSLSGFFTV